MRQKAVISDVPEKPVEILGPDAVLFLEKVLARKIARMTEGRGYYAFACTPQGGVFMDGVVFTIAANQFWYVQADGPFDETKKYFRSGYLDLNDPEGMCFAAIQAKNLEFAGKGCVHTKQIGSLNEVFTPPADQIARARQVIKEFEAADTGLLVVDGKLIEKPVLRDMHRIVAISDRISI